LTCGDLACGSGHILNEAFDLLYKIYTEEGYSRKNAVEDIFKYNLTGLDLDTRAKQLAQFALLLKACQKDNSFADAHCMPHVYDMPEPYENKEELLETLSHFLLGGDTTLKKESYEAIELMDNAKNYGSIMKFNISERTRNIIAARVEEYEKENIIPEPISTLLPYMHIILALTKKYATLCMNPPYMGSDNMNATLSRYVKENYEEGKADLATVFVELMPQRLKKNGKYGFIIPPSWMFLSTFEDLRRAMIEEQTFDSVLHLSRGVFGADFGASSAVLTNVENKSAKGTYFRLIERTFQEFDQKHLCELFEKTLKNPDFRFLFANYTKDIAEIAYNADGAKIYYSNIPQKNFEKIPGSPIDYWASEKMIECYSERILPDICETRCGMVTGRNEVFLRLWFEVPFKNIGFNLTQDEVKKSLKKWFPYDKGGEFRKWYGNQDHVVDWSDNGNELLTTMHPDGERIWAHNFNLDKIFLEHIGWSDICSTSINFRYYPIGFHFDGSANALFSNNNEMMLILGFANSAIAQSQKLLLNPTFHFKPGNFLSLPYKHIASQAIYNLVDSNIQISKQDWDAHETSWDFKQNELLRIIYENGLKQSTIESIIDKYDEHWRSLFYQLHDNEEELNRQFIEIYGLQDELTPEVPLNEVTIQQQGEIYFNEDNELVFDSEVLVKQLISYAIGCMMGRYSIDKPGLILANQGDGLKEFKELVPNSSFECDDDGIIPLMSAESEFADNAPLRLKSWLSTVFGSETLNENLNYIEKNLGKSIEDYFVKGFWTDHKKMYQYRPIYWLFRSKKGAFQCLVYMHRMNPYTAERIRTKYLLPHIEWLVNKQNEMQANAANLSTRERKQLDSITTQIEECREYHDRLHVIADQQINFDLDDGVVVNYAKFGDVLAKLK
jgi:hypothetical protein